MHEYTPHSAIYWLLCDSDDERLARLNFHLERDDYFPFLATVVGMFAEAARASSPEQAAFAEELRKDLIHLHERYQIVPREVPLSYSKRKVVRFDA